MGGVNPVISILASRVGGAVILTDDDKNDVKGYNGLMLFMGTPPIALWPFLVLSYP